MAHGINGHLNVTEWATLDGELPEEWQEGPCRNAMIFGSCFPDTGYGIGHPYGEIMHWPPFLQALIDTISTDPLGYSLETRCFVIGLAAHGLQDEIFDTFFLPQVDHYDQVGQETVDVGLEAILVADQVAQASPSVFVPHGLLIETLSAEFDTMVSVAELDEAARRVKIAVIDYFGALAKSQEAGARESMPWASTHYLDETVVGSLLSEIEPTRRYLRGVEARLRGGSASSDILTSFGGRIIYPSGINGAKRLGIVLARGVRVGSLGAGILWRERNFMAEPVRMFVEPGVWTQDEDDFTRVLWLSLGTNESLRDVLLQAPEEWEWIDGVDSVQDWFEVIPGPVSGLADSRSSVRMPPAHDHGNTMHLGASSSGTGCMTVVMANEGLSVVLLALLVGLHCFKRRDRRARTTLES